MGCPGTAGPGAPFRAVPGAAVETPERGRRPGNVPRGRRAGRRASVWDTRKRGRAGSCGGQCDSRGERKRDHETDGRGRRRAGDVCARRGPAWPRLSRLVARRGTAAGTSQRGKAGPAPVSPERTGEDGARPPPPCGTHCRSSRLGAAAQEGLTAGGRRPVLPGHAVPPGPASSVAVPGLLVAPLLPESAADGGIGWSGQRSYAK